MDHYVLEQVSGFLHQFRIQPDVAPSRVCPAPLCLHTLEEISRHGNVELSLPLSDQFRHGVMQKRLVRPDVGEIVLQSSVFYIDGSEGLSMFVWSPTNEASERAIAQLVQRSVS